jgi:hypothetical protein
VNKLLYISLVKFDKNRFVCMLKFLLGFYFFFPVKVIGYLYSNNFFIISDLSYFDLCFCKICYRL